MTADPLSVEGPTPEDAAFAAAAGALEALRGDGPLRAAIARAGGAIERALAGGGTVLAFGNGGSCADAGHFCEELTGRYQADRPGLAAVACTDAGHLTCTANDFGYDEVFARWVDALARPGDAVVALSTSGRSPNVLRGLEAARARGAVTIALLGRGGGAARALADHALVVPGEDAARVQELHMLILHAWCARLDRLPAARRGR